MPENFFRFEPIIYPIWRRKLPEFVRTFAEPLLRSAYPVQADVQPPADETAMARFLVDWGLFPAAELRDVATQLATIHIPCAVAERDAVPQSYEGEALRIPAQWEQTERVLVSWGRMYPTVWEMHAQLVEAISAVAGAEILVPTELWARAVALYLRERGKANPENLCFTVLRTDDIWVRDYGPIVAQAADGQRVVVAAQYDNHPEYPQADDNGMARRWAAHHSLPLMPLNLHTEGGNLWSDGVGTLLMTEQIFRRNPHYTPTSLRRYLHEVFDFEKLIITPRLPLETTGHIDLLVKLGNEHTVFLSAPNEPSAAADLRETRRILEAETNAQGQPYRIVELPTPERYVNWFTYSIRRSYTNALTVNGRILVPTYGIASDEIALRRYEEALPEMEIIPIDSSKGINGGGAVHCMTKEIPL